MVNLIVRISSIFSAAANFLQYSNSLRVVRATQTNAVNASTSGTGVLIKNTDDWTNNYASGGQAGNADFVARELGTDGNNLLVSTCPSATAYEQTLTTSQQVNDSLKQLATLLLLWTSDATTYLNVGDIIEFSTTGGATDFDDGEKYRVTGVSATDDYYRSTP